MKNIITTSTFSFDYDEETGVSIQKWYGDIDDEQYKINMLLWLDLLKKLPKKVPFSIVYPNLLYAISPELQDWTRDHITPQVQALGLKGGAIILPPEIDFSIEVLSIEQTVEESKDVFNTRYFHSEDEAMAYFRRNF